ncbi:hypothetical protein [Flammeovirga sp. SJP92]|uniref:hypothetical protein n=1 Tax=Flammeovirga sp. SJP92 TaxID=1775430 RepID=UPI000786F2BB|nr:hypothetical protein [Flammeovirga sp. SJP92]KXX66634.1 hypothetical protein AVL50_31565 [Flammeovirga sp. SJP92]
MNILQSLEAYTSAQKWVGINFIILGAILLVLAGIISFFVTKTPLASGMKWGSLVTGILIIIGGISYGNFNNKIQIEGKALYEKDSTEFIQTEHERMEKVDQGFLTYQLVFATFAVGAFAVILFFNAPFIKGIAFAVAILFTGLLIIEGFSHPSIQAYTEDLRLESQK